MRVIFLACVIGIKLILAEATKELGLSSIYIAYIKVFNNHRKAVGSGTKSCCSLFLILFSVKPRKTAIAGGI